MLDGTSFEMRLRMLGAAFEPQCVMDWELALDNGMLWVAMRNGNYWVARRNGKTQRWKRDHSRFRIPFKCGLKVTGAIDETTSSALGFKFSVGDPNQQRKRK
jgi:hypothetical protein